MRATVASWLSALVKLDEGSSAKTASCFTASRTITKASSLEPVSGDSSESKFIESRFAKVCCNSACALGNVERESATTLNPDLGETKDTTITAKALACDFDSFRL